MVGGWMQLQHQSWFSARLRENNFTTANTGPTPSRRANNHYFQKWILESTFKSALAVLILFSFIYGHSEHIKGPIRCQIHFASANNNLCHLTVNNLSRNKKSPSFTSFVWYTFQEVFWKSTLCDATKGWGCCITMDTTTPPDRCWLTRPLNHLFLFQGCKVVPLESGIKKIYNMRP